MGRESYDKVSDWFKMGDSMAQRMKFEQAEKAYRKATQIAPDIAETWIRLGNFLLTQSRVEDARIAFYKAAEKNPDLDIAEFEDSLSDKSTEIELNASELLREGIQLMLSHWFVKAQLLFDRALKMEPNNGAAWRLLGNVRLLLGDIKGARHAHKKSGALEPWSVKELQLDTELSKPAPEGAVFDHTQLLMHLMLDEPEIITAIMNQQIKDNKEEIDIAIGMFQSTLDDDPHQPEKWREYGDKLMLMRRYKEAAETFAKALELNLDDYECDFSYTLALYRSGITDVKYITFYDGMKRLLVKEKFRSEFITQVYKKYWPGFRGPDYYI